MSRLRPKTLHYLRRVTARGELFHKITVKRAHDPRWCYAGTLGAVRHLEEFMLLTAGCTE